MGGKEGGLLGKTEQQSVLEQDGRRVRAAALAVLWPNPSGDAPNAVIFNMEGQGPSRIKLFSALLLVLLWFETTQAKVRGWLFNFL